MCALLLLLPAAALADSAFDGTWKTRMESMKVTGKPDQFDVVGGVYTCESCTPQIQVAADGADHAVSGHPYYDTVAVTVVDTRAIRIVDKETGREVYNMTYSVSSDGKTLQATLTDYSGPQVASGAFTAKRVAAGPAGSHATSGSWQPERMSDANDALRIISYQMTPEGFIMRWNGQSYRARFDGQQYSVEGDPAHTMVVVRRIDTNTVEETDYRGGKATDEIRMATAPDGKTMQVTDTDLEHGQTTTVTLEKQ